MGRQQRVVVLGDSISTDVFAGAGNNWATKLLAGLPRKFELVNLAVSGRSLATIAGASAVLADVYQRLTIGPPTLFVVFAGTNDISGATATGAQCLATETTLCGLIQATGARVITVTTLPRGEAAGASTTFNTERGVYNAGKRAGTYHNGYVDLDTVSQLMNPADTTYYVDTTHPNATGENLIAAAIRPVMLRWLA